jgi:thiol-disulfide isomerase/thioredoxin
VEFEVLQLCKWNFTFFGGKMSYFIGATAFLLSTVLISTASTAQTVSPFVLEWYNFGETIGEYKSEDHPGATFVLEIFANSCGACNANAVNVEALAEEFKDNPKVQVLDVGIAQQPRELRAWIERHAPKHPVVQGKRSLMLELGGITSTPTAVILNCKLEVIHKTSGRWTPAVAEKLREVIQASLMDASCGIDEP